MNANRYDQVPIGLRPFQAPHSLECAGSLPRRSWTEAGAQRRRRFLRATRRESRIADPASDTPRRKSGVALRFPPHSTASRFMAAKRVRSLEIGTLHEPPADSLCVSAPLRAQISRAETPGRGEDRRVHGPDSRPILEWEATHEPYPYPKLGEVRQVLDCGGRADRHAEARRRRERRHRFLQVTRQEFRGADSSSGAPRRKSGVARSLPAALQSS